MHRLQEQYRKTGLKGKKVGKNAWHFSKFCHSHFSFYGQIFVIIKYLNLKNLGSSVSASVTQVI